MSVWHELESELCGVLDDELHKTHTLTTSVEADVRRLLDGLRSNRPAAEAESAAQAPVEAPVVAEESEVVKEAEGGTTVGEAEASGTEEPAGDSQ